MISQEAFLLKYAGVAKNMCSPKIKLQLSVYQFINYFTQVVKFHRKTINLLIISKITNTDLHLFATQ